MYYESYTLQCAVSFKICPPCIFYVRLASLIGMFPFTVCRNHRVLQDVTEQATRFIGLAKVGNDRKAKFLYAFNIVPMKELSRVELTDQPPDTTEFPYAEVIRDLLLVEREKDRKNDQQFFFDMNPSLEEDAGGRSGRGGRKRPWQDNAGKGRRFIGWNYCGVILP